MKTTSAVLFSAIALFAAASAHASQGYDQYRRAVLGDTTIAAPAAVSGPRTELVPGAYAQHLISIGTSKSDALAQAARIGEAGVVRSVAVKAPQRPLTGAQAHAKYLGYDVVGSEAVGNAE